MKDAFKHRIPSAIRIILAAFLLIMPILLSSDDILLETDSITDWRGWDNRWASFEFADCTSTLNQDRESYGPMNTMDENFQTAWCEGAEENGLGEMVWQYALESDFPTQPKILTGLIIANGYTKSPEIFSNNARAELIRIKAHDFEMVARLLDSDQQQYIEFPFPIITKYLGIEILSAYPGEVYQDLCITEIFPVSEDVDNIQECLQTCDRIADQCIQDHFEDVTYYEICENQWDICIDDCSIEK